MAKGPVIASRIVGRCELCTIPIKEPAVIEHPPAYIDRIEPDQLCQSVRAVIVITIYLVGNSLLSRVSVA